MPEQLPEDPVGPQYGLEPRRPELYSSLASPVTSQSLVSTEDYRKGTEFGGVGGLIQPAPHVPTAGERLHMIYAIDPTDDGTEPGSVVPPDLEGPY